MTEQLNERESIHEQVARRDERVAQAAFRCGLASDGWQDVIDAIVALGPDPRAARITELEAEVARLNGLLDEAGRCAKFIEAFFMDGVVSWSILTKEYMYEAEGVFREFLEGLSRRTAERKEPTDASD